jgi:hypothetical protein
MQHKSGLVVTSVNEDLAWCESLLLRLVSESMRRNLRRFSSSENFHGEFDDFCKIWGFHSGDYEESRLMGGDDVW